MRGIAITVAVATLARAAACGPPKNRTEDLLASVRTYQEGLRWERFTNAASRVPPAERDQFLDEREDLIDDLHITNYELVKVEAAKHDVARIEVKYTWYRDAEGTVQHTRAVETWEKHGRVWLLIARSTGATAPRCRACPSRATTPARRRGRGRRRPRRRGRRRPGRGSRRSRPGRRRRPRAAVTPWMS